jgi:hypothetical protein
MQKISCKDLLIEEHTLIFLFSNKNKDLIQKERVVEEDQCTHNTISQTKLIMQKMKSKKTCLSNANKNRFPINNNPKLKKINNNLFSKHSGTKP